MKFAGMKALVTGGSQGIGRVICLELAREGAEVIVNCAHSPAKAQAVADEIVANGGKASVEICDVTDEQAVAALIARLAPLHILVNNARIDPYFRKPEYTEGQWWSMVMDVNLKGAYLCTYEFFKQAKENRFGRIINIASVRSFIPAEPHMVAYGVSKLGMHGITRSFAYNGASYGITANTICPGMVVTENIGKRLTQEQIDQATAEIPVRRAATSEEIADAVIFACNNGFVNGETINVNGGVYFAP